MSHTGDNLLYNLKRYNIVRKIGSFDFGDVDGTKDNNYKLEVESSGGDESISTIPIITILKNVLILLFFGKEKRISVLIGCVNYY